MKPRNRFFIGAVTGSLLIGVIFLLRSAQHQTAISEKVRAVFPDAANKVLESSGDVTLLSLDPLGPDEDKTKNLFHGYRVFGRTKLSPAVRDELVGALYEAMADPTATGMSCFDPRHGLHAVNDGRVVDLVICFWCEQVLIYSSSTSEPAGGSNPYLTVSRSAGPVFDAVLRKARVPSAIPHK